jgi:hypothetical protein
VHKFTFARVPRLLSDVRSGCKFRSRLAKRRGQERSRVVPAVACRPFATSDCTSIRSIISPKPWRKVSFRSLGNSLSSCKPDHCTVYFVTEDSEFGCCPKAAPFPFVGLYDTQNK